MNRAPTVPRAHCKIIISCWREGSDLVPNLFLGLRPSRLSGAMRTGVGAPNGRTHEVTH